MKLFKLILVLLGMFFLNSCKDNEQIVQANNNSIIYLEQEDIKAIKDKIIREYSLVDQNIYSSWENCYFTNYINDETFIVNNYYDILESGLQIKYFYCPYNNLYYNVIRSFSGDIFYRSLVEIKVINDFIEKEYIGKGGYYESQRDLQIINFDSYRFNQILSSDNLFNLSQNDYNDEQRTALMFKLIENMIQYSFYIKRDNLTIEPIFDDVISLAELEDTLLEMKGLRSTLNVDEVNKILRPIMNLGTDNLTNKVFILKVNNLGLFIFSIKKTNNKYLVEEKIIPVLKRASELGSDLSYIGTYNECDQL